MFEYNNNTDYDSKQADYILRETISTLKGHIDLLFLGILEESTPQEQEEFLKRIKKSSDNLYNLLKSTIVEKADKIQSLNKIIKKDMLLAQKIQSNIMPGNFSHLRDFKIKIRYKPLMEVGGDFYDVHPLSPGKLRIFLTDATGHGVQAALITMLIKSEYEKLKQSSLSPDILLQQLNYEFCTTYRSLNVFFNAIIVDIDRNNGTLSYSSAGHPDQFLVRGDTLLPLHSNGKLLGVISDTFYIKESLEIQPGDRLFLFTDGAFEEFDPHNKEFGEENLIEILKKNPSHSIDSVIDLTLLEINAFIGNNPVNDDITLIGIEIL